MIQILATVFFAIIATVSGWTFTHQEFEPISLQAATFGDSTVRTLPGFTASTTAGGIQVITQRIADRPIVITGLDDGCVELLNGFATTTTGLPCGSGSGSGASSTIIKISGVTSNTGVPTIDFVGGLSVTESPADEFNITGLASASVSSSTLSISNWANGRVLQASTTASGGFDWVATSTLGFGSGAGDGVSNWLYDGSRLSPSTTVGIGVFASSTIGGGTGATGLTIAGNGTTTGNIYVGGNIYCTTDPCSFYGTQGVSAVTVNFAGGTTLGYGNTNTVSTGGAIQQIVGGNEIARWTATGLGIGTTSPSRKLTVQGGDIWVGGNMIATGTASSTYASTSALTVHAALSLFGGSQVATANALCIQLTGSADLCDGSDASGAGGSQDWFKNAALTQISPSTTVGLLIQGATSTFATTSIKNLLVGDATNTKQSVGGGGPESLSNVRSSANNLFIWSGLPGDTEGRWLVESSGLMGWGAGGSSDQDINLFRNAANNLTVQSFTADGTDVFRVNDVDSNKIFGVNTVSNYIEAPKLIVNGANGGALLDVYGGGSTAIRAEQDAASSVGFSSYVTGDAQLRFSFLADGTQRWGSGSAVGDTVLARVAANQLALTGTTGQARFGIGSSTPSRALTVNGDVYATGTVTGADGIFTTSFTLPNGSNPTVDATGEIALNTAHNALSVATSTTALEFPMYPPISFAFASSSWTGTTTEVSYVTLPNFDELITSGICFANGSAKIIVGNGTASSSLTTLSAGTTTVNVNTRFNKNGTRIIFALGTPSTVTTVNCKFERVYLR